MSQIPQPSAASIVLREKRERRLRRRRRVIAGTVAVALLLIGFFVLPPVIKWQAEKRLSAELNREVTIETLRLNPFKLSVTIDGLKITDRDGGPFTAWRRLYVNFDSFSFFTGEWRFDKIALDGLAQRVAIAEDGTFNFSDLIPASDETKPEPTEPARPIRIQQLVVTDAAVAFSDHSREQPFVTDLGPLTFALENFLSAGDPKAPYQFSAATEAGETFSWRGTVSVDPIRSAGEFSLGKISLKKYAPYYADFINADMLGGSLDVVARYAIDLAEATHELTVSDAEIKLTGLQVAARGSTTPLIDLPLIAIDGVSANGLTTSATIGRVALEGGRLTVVRESDGSINLLKLLPTAPAGASATGAGAPPAAQTANDIPDVKLTELSLSGLAIDFEDRTTPTPAKLGIGDLDVLVKNISLAEPAVPVLVSVSADLVPSGAVKVQGTATLEPFSADLQLELDAFPLASAMPYVEPLLNLRIAGGVVSMDGFLKLAGSVADLQGNVVMDQFATVDGVKGEDFAKFAKLEVRGIQALSEPVTAHVAEIRIVDPLARVVINPDGSLNIDKILREAAPAEAGNDAAPVVTLPNSNAPETPAPNWSLGKFTLSNGRVELADRSIKPEVRMSLDQFSGTVTGLSSAAEKRADVNIRGKVNRAGAVSVAGKLDTAAFTRTPGALTDLELDVRGVDLSALSPYVAKYAGYELVRSGLSVDVNAKLAQRQIDTSNVIVLQQFTLGQPSNSPEATSLPVRLGVALLKDREGNIVIDIPVKGDLDDPEFKIGRVVLRVITNLLAKAATSPFSLIGAAFGGGGEELAYQTFNPGTSEPAEGELKKIETLRKALLGRPALNLDISGSFEAETDRAALREQTLARQIRFRRWEELRRENPDTPPPAEIKVAPDDERRILGVFLAERYPGGIPTVAEDGTLTPPPPLFVPLPAPQEEQPKSASRGPVSRRNQRVFGGSGVTSRAARETAPEPDPLKPVELVPSAEVAGASPDGAASITLEAARRALASGIPVSDDDLLKLAADRAQKVRDALLAGGEIAEERLFLTPPAPEGKGAKVFLQLR